MCVSVQILTLRIEAKRPRVSEVSQSRTALVNFFWRCNMSKCVIRTTVGDLHQKNNWQILIFNNQVMSGVFQFLKGYEKFLTVYR